MRKRYNTMAAIYGLEGEDTPIVDNADSDAALVESSSEVDATLDDTETALDTSDTLAADAETVENVTEIVEDSVESGEGLDDTSAAIVQETIENIMRRHGMPRRTWPKFPSKESFSDRSSRLRASRQILISLEEGVWDKIKNGITKVWETIRDFFVGLWRKMTDFEFRLLEKFKDLKANAAELKNETGDDIEISSADTFLTASSETIQLSDVVSAFKEFSDQVTSDKFKKTLKEVEMMLDKNEFAYNTSEKQKDDRNEAMKKKNESYTKDMQEGADSELDEAKLRSAFSNIHQNEDREGKGKKIKRTTKAEATKACDEAINLLRTKPMVQMNKVSDNFIMHILKTIKAFFTNDDGRKANGNKMSDAEGGIKYDKDVEGGHKEGGKEIFQKMASAYKYIMYNNIKIYKETISNYYDIVDDLVSEQGHDDAKTDDKRSIDDF